MTALGVKPSNLTVVVLAPKVLTYITHAGCLLVFRQPHAPLQGVQVPGGSIEPGETMAEAALREAREETGLVQLTLGAYLGCTEYALQVDVGPGHLRHFFHIVAKGAPARRWLHEEAPTPTRSETVLRELWWEPLESVALGWQMGALLPSLTAPLRI